MVNYLKREKKSTETSISFYDSQYASALCVFAHRCRWRQIVQYDFIYSDKVYNNLSHCSLKKSILYILYKLCHITILHRWASQRQTTKFKWKTKAQQRSEEQNMDPFPSIWTFNFNLFYHNNLRWIHIYIYMNIAYTYLFRFSDSFVPG